MDNSEFTLVFRGYDKDEVDTSFAELRTELEHVRDYNFKAASEVEFLKNEIASLKQRLKKGGTSGYAELGAQFEQTLRVAEEQAKKLMTDAGQDALRIRETAKAESEQLTRKAQAKAESILSDAETKAKEEAAAKEKEEQSKKSQESPSTLLAELNTKMAQLIKLQAQTTTNTYENVMATKGLNKNLYKA